MRYRRTRNASQFQKGLRSRMACNITYPQQHKLCVVEHLSIYWCVQGAICSQFPLSLGRKGKNASLVCCTCYGFIGHQCGAQRQNVFGNARNVRENNSSCETSRYVTLFVGSCYDVATYMCHIRITSMPSELDLEMPRNVRTGMYDLSHSQLFRRAAPCVRRIISWEPLTRIFRIKTEQHAQIFNTPCTTKFIPSDAWP